MKRVLVTGLTFGGKVWLKGELVDPALYPNVDFNRVDRFADVEEESPKEETSTEGTSVKQNSMLCPFCQRGPFKQQTRLENHIVQCIENPANKPKIEIPKIIGMPETEDTTEPSEV
jgi:hypothetical protein